MRKQLAGCLFFSSLFANPSGPAVLAGQASFAEQGLELSIATQGRTIIDWDRFSIDAGEITRFLQDAPVLNRVIGADPSVLMGLLEANGEIYLLNPQGILVGKDALIQTAGFIASTLNIDNAVFLAGGKLEFLGSSIASIVFEGTHNVVEEKGCFFLVSNDTTELKGQVAASEVRILGDKVHLYETAKIDAPGGEVLVGGDFKGQNPDVKNARTTRVDPGACIHIDGREGEDGGKAIVWADDATWFSGTISGRGINGGFVEVSGKQKLRYDGFSDLRPRGGKFGSLLLDPKNIVIDAGAGAVMPGINTDFGNMVGATVTMGAANVGAAIDAADLTLQANTDITFDAAVTATVAGRSLTLQAGRSILFNAAGNLTLVGGAFTATINDSGATMGDRDAGAAQFTLSGTSSVLTAGGNVLIDHGSFANGDVGEVILNGGSVINSGTGRIDIFGDGIDIADGGSQIGIQALGQLTTTGIGAGAGIALTGNGAAMGTIDGNIGVQTALAISANEGEIAITGNGGGLAGTSQNDGIRIGGTITSTGIGADAARITLLGTGGAGLSSNYGVRISSTLTSADGDISITGTGQGTGMDCVGVSTSRINSLGTGANAADITVTGFGSTLAMGDGNSGVLIATPNTFNTVDGDIAINGTGGGGPLTNGNLGIAVSSGVGNGINSTGMGASAGTITLIGVAGAGDSGNDGIVFSGLAQVSSTDGDIVLNGTGQGTGSSNRGVMMNNRSNINSLGLTSDAADIFVIGNGAAGGLNGNSGVILDGVFTSAGDVSIQGTTSSTGSLNHGIEMTTDQVSSSGTSPNAGLITLTGTVLSGMANNYGLYIAGGSVNSTDGDINITGTGLAGVVSSYGIFLDLGSTISALGNANLILTTPANGMTLNGSITTSTGTQSILALNSNADLFFGGAMSLSCGGNFIAAANNNISIEGGVTHSITGDAVYIVDEQSAAAVGLGTFTNDGTISVASNNLAIYASSGPSEPLGLTPGAVQFSSNSPATAVIGTWDSPAPAGANPPIPLNAKYSTSYQGGGPYHGPGFGMSYLPGNGVFGSQVVWYKYTGLTPPSPIILPTVAIPAVQKALSLIGVNTLIFPPQNYLLTPYLPCPILPCLEFLCENNKL